MQRRRITLLALIYILILPGGAAIIDALPEFTANSAASSLLIADGATRAFSR